MVLPSAVGFFGIGGGGIGGSGSTEGFGEESIRRGIQFLGTRRFGNVTSNTEVNAHILTGDLEVYMRITCSPEGNVRFRFFEDSTFSVDGTVLTPHNRNRNSPITAQTQLWYAATFSTIGSQIGIYVVNGATRNIQEFLLKPNTEHYLALRNDAGVTNDIGIEFDFYERGADLI